MSLLCFDKFKLHMFFRVTLGNHEADLFPVDQFPVVSGPDLGGSL